MTAQTGGRILVVDDEPFNLEILTEHLSDAGYSTVTAEDGQEAWEHLQHDRDFEAILLDRMMPRMNGMELLAQLKQSPALKYIPVVLQTAVGAADSVREGLLAGAYYYLTKPFDRAMLLAIVAAAVSDSQARSGVLKSLESQRGAISLLQRGEFFCHTLEEARELTGLLAAAFPDPERVALGLSELLINAIEHGNLGIGYDEKSRLLRDGVWQDEINLRLQDARYRDKRVNIQIERLPHVITLTVRDEGKGFDWRPFLNFTPERAFDPHGRGISMSRLMSFDTLEYQGSGNEVIVRVVIQREPQ